MRKLFFTISCLFLGLGLSAQVYTIDAGSSSIKWVGKKVTGKHMGTLGVQSGTILQQGNIYSGLFGIDMASIECTDLEGEQAANLVGHLASEDFFNVAEYSSAVFNLNSIVANDAGGHTVNGELTIKGITNAITFPATVAVADGVLSASAKTSIDRTKWDVKYGSGSFFDGLGDKVIYDDIELEINIVAK